ncbi:MAG: hypothetical protein KIT43_06470 [Bauldia sp.]|nr:hypothetical protein [Bauldia sp.]MCW5717265.1 hypothetical protein [Bauldia sp.]
MIAALRKASLWSSLAKALGPWSERIGYFSVFAIPLLELSAPLVAQFLGVEFVIPGSLILIFFAGYCIFLGRILHSLTCPEEIARFKDFDLFLENRIFFVTNLATYDQRDKDQFKAAVIAAADVSLSQDEKDKLADLCLSAVVGMTKDPNSADQMIAQVQKESKHTWDQKNRSITLARWLILCLLVFAAGVFLWNTFVRTLIAIMN